VPARGPGRAGLDPERSPAQRPRAGRLRALEMAHRGFNVIATANLRDKGVSEMSAALKRRFNFETVAPIADLARGDRAGAAAVAADRRRGGRAARGRRCDARGAWSRCFADLRTGRTVEGWAVERPSSVMSTAEAVAVASSIGLAATYFPTDRDIRAAGPRVPARRGDEGRSQRIAASCSRTGTQTVKRRAEGEARLWKQLHELRRVLRVSRAVARALAPTDDPAGRDRRAGGLRRAVAVRDPASLSGVRRCVAAAARSGSRPPRSRRAAV